MGGGSGAGLRCSFVKRHITFSPVASVAKNMTSYVDFPF